MSTSFWHDQWLGDSCLRLSYPRLFALENNKVCSVAAKMSAPFVSSLRRDVRGGEESAQLSRISDLLDTVVLSNMGDRRFWDLNGDGCFRVKDVRRLLDDMLLPKSDVPSRWVKQIPIKVNVLAWKISMDRLPTRVNLHRRGVQVSPISCPICCEALENLDHLLFCCDLAKDIARSICNWWGLVWNPVDSYRSWLSWFNLVQLQSSSKQVLEGVFYTSWWSIWSYRNHLLFSDSNLRKDAFVTSSMAIPSSSHPNQNNTQNQNNNQNHNQNDNVINDPFYLSNVRSSRMSSTNTSFNGSNFHRWNRNSACELWKEIAERYGHSNGPLIYQLERELSKITQGNLTIASYFNKLKKCWDELQNINGLPTCNYGRMREYPDWYKGKKAKKQGRMATNVNSRFDDHFSADAPFDICYENEMGGGVDQRLVAAVCQEMMKMFKGK
ncbi:RNA-directed DNA polymerase, eukaryota [Tanacetum coccineum]